ncbi:MAG: replication-associated recombination protein A [bacterium]
MSRPLYSEIRPETLDDVVEQKHIVRLIRAFIDRDYLPSMIFYGPPGTGKTTVAKIAAELFDARIYMFSAVKHSVKDIKNIVYKEVGTVLARRQMVFLDELHRFNKSQQDIFLPMIENDGVIFIGATTENPSFYVNNALISRSRPIKFNKITETGVFDVLKKGSEYLGISPDEDLLSYMAKAADGDIRAALTMLESAYFMSGKDKIGVETVEELMTKPSTYDKKYDSHYRIISAFIKSLRGSDADAALYYLVKMLEGGEDPLFILRRMVIFASEDVGNADPRALSVAVNGLAGFERVGMPEGEIIISQVLTYLASAPKSNASYKALGKAKDFFKKHPGLNPPSATINKISLAPGEKSEKYKYPHDYPGHYVKQRYFPEGFNPPPKFYELSSVGYESKLSAFWKSVTEGKSGKK